MITATRFSLPCSDVPTVVHEDSSFTLALQDNGSKWNMVTVQRYLQALAGPSHNEQGLWEPLTLQGHLDKRQALPQATLKRLFKPLLRTG